MKQAYFPDSDHQHALSHQHTNPSKQLHAITHPRYHGPELTLDLSIIDQQVTLFKQALPQVPAHFAVKANPLPELLLHLKNLGVHFEIASLGELELMQSLNIPSDHLIFSNPIKTPASIIAAVNYGVKWFSFDCKEELDKLFVLAPNAHYELRITTTGKGAVWPLTTKFGVGMCDAKALIDYAAQRHMNVAGLTFHVGSQCTRAQSWVESIEQCQSLFSYMKAKGLTPALLNLGGGFPCAIYNMAPSLTSMMKPVHAALDNLPKNIQLVAEPGRFLVAAAGTLTCQIISATERNSQNWAYLDCGYYNGLMELKEGFSYELKSRRKGILIPWIIAGPTCDSLDMFEQPYLLPANSQAGDIIDIPNLGAYANTCASNFNGFDIPTINIIK
jgi:ornithine decarboxylase